MSDFKNLPLEVVRAMTAERTGAVIVWLMKVYDGTQTAYFANDNADIVGPDGQTYRAYPFAITLPSQKEGETPTVNITVQDVPQDVLALVLEARRARRTIQVDVHVVQRGVTQASSGTKRTWHEPIVSYRGLEALKAKNNEKTLTFGASLAPYFDRPMGLHTYNPGDFPGGF